MITSFQVEGFRCLKKVEVKLTPLHALIGPNDSGKSSLLIALERACSAITNNRTVGFSCYLVDDESDSVTLKPRQTPSRHSLVPRANPLDYGWGRFRGVRLLRFEPDELRAPSGLIPQGQPLTITEKGRNLPAVYDHILNRGDETFHKIASDIRGLFPTIKHLRMKAVDASTKTFEADLVDGARVGAESFSEGLLYYLAFAALPYLDPVSLLLIEEPENGLHPARIREVMSVLRAISDGGTQIVLATHSPLVVNELRPEEVSVVTRTPAEGTKVTPIKDTPRFEERAKVYALGELWLSYADGNLEAPLLEGTSRP